MHTLQRFHYNDYHSVMNIIPTHTYCTCTCRNTCTCTCIPPTCTCTETRSQWLYYCPIHWYTLSLFCHSFVLQVLLHVLYMHIHVHVPQWSIWKLVRLYNQRRVSSRHVRTVSTKSHQSVPLVCEQPLMGSDSWRIGKRERERTCTCRLKLMYCTCTAHAMHQGDPYQPKKQDKIIN